MEEEKEVLSKRKRDEKQENQEKEEYPTKKAKSETDLEKKPDDSTKNDTTTESNPKKSTRRAISANPVSTRKYKKRNLAFVFSYIGTGYKGLQHQGENIKTIEKVIWDAVKKGELVSKMNSQGGIGKVRWQRSSRTDKGVHALYSIINFKCLEYPDILDRIRRNLPEGCNIACHGFNRVTKSFNAKSFATSRKYIYICPTFVFNKFDEILKEVSFESKEEREKYIKELSKKVDTSYRIDKEKLENVQRLFKGYIGTKSYRNFTKIQKSKQINAESLKRYIKNCEASEPFLSPEINGKQIEYVKITIYGQSFVLNQIRKMVAFVIMIMQGVYKEEEFKLAFDKKKKYSIPMAPGFALYLRDIEFSNYNKGRGDIHGRIEFKNYEKELLEFEKKIVQHIMKLESERMGFEEYLATMCKWAMAIKMNRTKNIDEKK